MISDSTKIVHEKVVVDKHKNANIEFKMITFMSVRFSIFYGMYFL